jgi:mRNA deadenylase 3'-5' endonuclease subunit Ccr4
MCVHLHLFLPTYPFFRSIYIYQSKHLYINPSLPSMYPSNFSCTTIFYNRSHEFYVDIHSRYNSVVMVLFKVNSSNRTFIVANTHLYWNPEREDIKVAQTLGTLSMQYIHTFIRTCSFISVFGL